MKQFLFLAMLALSSMSILAYDFVVDGIAYNITSSSDLTVEVTYKGFSRSTYSYSGSAYSYQSNNYTGIKNIPETVYYSNNTYTVTSIGENAFGSYFDSGYDRQYGIYNSISTKFCLKNDNLKSVTIPETVTSIGANAFGCCSGLTTLTLPNSLKNIGEYAFSGCIGLTSISIPNSVTSIGEQAFYGCSSLTSVTIGNSVTSIGSSAFYECKGLTSVHITDLTAWNNITYGDIESQPLYYAHHLFLNGQEITGDFVIPEYLTHIGDYAFCGCSGLTSVTIPENVTYLGAGSFYNCPRIKHIYVCSQMPADCGSNTTFYCKTGVRDGYDVYNYAILHVPMGSKEEYAAAYEWRYFIKIKEDLDINGQVFYTTLSINHAGDGYVKHYVKADEPYTLYIGSEEGMRINTVLFNGEDVTDCLVDGYYTTPNITRPSKIVVSFEQDPDGIESVSADDRLHVYGNDGSLYVSGIEGPQGMSVYSVNGMLVNSQTLDGDTKIKLNEGIYIVKVGERTFKVSL